MEQFDYREKGLIAEEVTISQKNEGWLMKKRKNNNA